ncbi:hypothetical protein DAPPUDRAFT_246765 [Daphnia pulex]|uniref:Uncharacterized protein n=1 Tax=Daphnia pulex TaxID=6669 RepID=E9GR70_DAPPU|nr:hypothetical protein DAPPUDRAFT_246765 [Daphnia pulex]|eukprot:EFX78044.1 hypothetical protein DAPPUDRAFT_246765 [Daphnia pulex]
MRGGDQVNGAPGIYQQQHNVNTQHQGGQNYGTRFLSKQVRSRFKFKFDQYLSIQSYQFRVQVSTFCRSISYSGAQQQPGGAITDASRNG